MQGLPREAVAPVTWPVLAPKPWRRPVVSATMLTGPGEIEGASANELVEI
ncbi:hypothetical protein SAMCCGM7_pC0063 (plasmid) [Sinorhizobium americanum CCGM7]|nr:hypothetical protein SAMCCGM7_pC0063 [Sinorhizobium americanum CCGM7]